jgi:plastocyanin
MVLFWAVLIGGAIWLVLRWGRNTGGGGDAELLRTRLASGEIDVEEFEQRNAALRRGSDRSFAGPLVAVIAAIALLVVIPAVIMAATSWDMDMWNMHGAGQDNSGDPVVRGGTEAIIRINGFAFEPGNLEVPAGARVTWTNDDAAPHDATARDGYWETERLSEDESDSLELARPGTYDYYCSIHPGMKARVVVR